MQLNFIRRRRRLKGSDEGYTLTEILVVLAIIGLIAAVLTPGLIGQLGRARAKTAQMQLDTISAAVESFRSDVGRYPTQSEGLALLVAIPSDMPGWNGPYLKNSNLLQDPWGNPVQYLPDPSGQTYLVKSLGSDGQPGGSGTARDLQSPSS